MLLGNKSDMASERIIKTEDGEKLAKVCCDCNIFDTLNFSGSSIAGPFPTSVEGDV
jgi:hypothetical protein